MSPFVCCCQIVARSIQNGFERLWTIMNYKSLKINMILSYFSSLKFVVALPNRTFNPLVASSNLAGPTKKYNETMLRYL